MQTSALDSKPLQMCVALDPRHWSTGVLGNRVCSVPVCKGGLQLFATVLPVRLICSASRGSIPALHVCLSNSTCCTPGLFLVCCVV